MKVYLQWTKAHPTDWVEFDVQDTPQLRRAWERLASKPQPVGGETIDDTDGWVFDVNIQGITFGGADHYAVELLTTPEFGLRVTTWVDDPDDGYPLRALVWTLLEPAPDPALGGIINTRQSRVVYAENPQPGELPYSEFVPPDAALVRHGIWVTDELVEQHVVARRRHGWREWITP